VEDTVEEEVEIKGKEEEVILEATMVMIEVSEGFILIID
jgi:hypothetical protein